MTSRRWPRHSIASAVSQYVRMSGALRQYLRTPQPLDWEEMVRLGLASRERNFLETVRRGVFEQPSNPYLEMMRQAGCTYGDLERGVCRDGVETTLRLLAREQVYLTHDEFKGKQPIVRSGRHLVAGPSCFANPLVRGGLEISSGGSRSNGTQSRTAVAHRLHREAYTALHSRELGLADRRYVCVRPILPAIAGLADVLHFARLGHALDHWFAPGGDSAASLHYRAMTGYLVALQRLHGLRVPFPSYLPGNDFSPAAAWIARRGRQGVRSTVGCYVSHGVRVAATALENGWDIEGSLFLVGGEALTESKRRVIESAGGEVFTRYFITEIGALGFACRQMRTGNCVHLFSDSVATVNPPEDAPLFSTVVSPLLFTTLVPYAPHILINAEMGDSAVLETAPCDCLFSRLGFRTRLRDIWSYDKLTGHGVTLAGSDLLRILEESLPSRFGGSPADYQLVESEGKAQTELTLLVSPRVPISSTGEVTRFFLAEVRRTHGGALASRLWSHAGSFQVLLREPYSTPAGKVLSLHLLRASNELSL